MKPGRRDALKLAAAIAATGLAPRPATAAGKVVRLICGFGVGNPTDLCAQLIQEGFSAALGEPVEFDYALGQAGRLAALEVIAAAPDGHTLLIAEILNLVLQDTPADPLVSRLQPIGKITRGFSTALVVNQFSDIEDWQDLLSAARSSQGASRLKAATTGRDSTVGLLLPLVERRMKLAFDAVDVASSSAAIALLLTRRAAIAAVDTRTALLHNARDRTKLRVIATSGAQRSPALPEVPTLAELVADPKFAYTISFGLFAPLQTEPAVSARLTAALVGMKDDRSLHSQARLAQIPVQLEGPRAVVETIARDRRIAAGLAG
jgi:tripartite-type tricarboxylate transporter receptor subunit TctC